MATMESTPTSKVPDATRLAVERTRLAHERTLMAWVRTATSLISFGFTIYKFFQYLRQDVQEKPPQLLGTRHFALLMILIGLVALVVATIQHTQSMRALRAEYHGVPVPYSLAAIMAILIGALGIVGLFSVIFRQ
jgi:putative membrane protein